MERQRERLEEIVRVEGPGTAVERGREVGGSEEDGSGKALDN